jgi:hypothetical protein
MAATYVLVHGGGPGGWCYQPVAGLPQSHLCTTLYMRWRDVVDLRQKANGRVWDLDTGHDMMITEPGWVADKLMLLALGAADVH